MKNFLEGKILIFKTYGFWQSFKFLILEVYHYLWYQKFRKSFSQGGEDIVIDNLLGNKKQGFYVDIGAYDPTRFSNTKRFYLRGWRGINIEPHPENFKKFIKARKRDINLNMGIGKKDSEAVFYKMEPSTLSSFSKFKTEEYQKQGYKIVSKMKVKVKRLEDILSKYGRCAIDFISIDTEGYEMEVLKSNDWARFRPRLLCIESVSHNREQKKVIKDTMIEKFLLGQEYKICWDNGLNSIFIDVRSSGFTSER